MTIAAACGPKMIARRTAPTICPLVPGIAGSWKFTICAAKTNAPKIPIRASLSEVIICLSFLQIKPRPAAAIASVPAATGTDSNSLAICIIKSSQMFFDYIFICFFKFCFKNLLLPSHQVPQRRWLFLCRLGL